MLKQTRKNHQKNHLNVTLDVKQKKRKHSLVRNTKMSSEIKLEETTHSLSLSHSFSSPFLSLSIWHLFFIVFVTSVIKCWFEWKVRDLNLNFYIRGEEAEQEWSRNRHQSKCRSQNVFVWVHLGCQGSRCWNKASSFLLPSLLVGNIVKFVHKMSRSLGISVREK